MARDSDEVNAEISGSEICALFEVEETDCTITFEKN